jgi:hypothetical protein
MNYCYVLFLIAIIIIFSYINTLHYTEQFTPEIRKIYRPIIRNTRLISEGFYNNTTSTVSNLLRKMKII